jgi:rhamnosyltransferase
MTIKKVNAIVVAYNPTGPMLMLNLQSLINQVSQIIIVDNSDPRDETVKTVVEKMDCEKIITIRNFTNLGVSHAQNQGIEIAIQNNADFVLLSDQDSIFPVEYVQIMLSEYENAVSRKERLAVVGPIFKDVNKGASPQGFVIFQGLFNWRIFPKNGSHKVTQLIASGMFIPIEVFSDIGKMSEDLFIDWVDIEWCWRARAKGYVVLGCADVSISHNLGDFSRKIAFSEYPIRSPLRHYYVVRNALFLAMHSKVINFGMRINLLYKTVKYLLGFSILGRPHLVHLEHCLMGIFDALTMKMGKKW